MPRSLNSQLRKLNVHLSVWLLFGPEFSGKTLSNLPSRTVKNVQKCAIIIPPPVQGWYEVSLAPVFFR